MADPFALGPALQALQTADERTRRGAWFTPAHLARQLSAQVLELWRAGAGPGHRSPSVIDPAAGAGVFLLAMHELDPDADLHAIDIDPASTSTMAAALAQAGADAAVITGDGLDPGLHGTHDIVIGNPPFLSQLGFQTARDADRRARLRDWYGDAAAGYVDEAGLFVLAASQMLSPGGVAVLIVPEALLATDSARGIRALVATRCDPTIIWRDRDRTFDTVATCALALRRRASSSGPGDADWAWMLADGVPSIDLPQQTATIGDRAWATADFRDAYYLVADHVREQQADEGVPIVPVGLIDPAHNRWGRTTVRFAKQRFTRPVAIGLPPDFLAARLGPKLLVATQTKVLETIVDAAGELLPTTPAITVRTTEPWHVGAALTSPIATAVAARRHSGAARSREALKLSAKQIMALPLPGPAGDQQAWDSAAAAFRKAHDDAGARDELIAECGRQMWAAHGLPVDDAAQDWWEQRLPRRMLHR